MLRDSCLTIIERLLFMDKQQLLLYLDKFIDEAAQEERNIIPMGKERRRVIIGYNDDNTPIYKILQANTQDEMNNKIVKAYIESGRIKELLPNQPLTESVQSEIPLLKSYADEWIKRKRKLKDTTRVNYLKYLNEYILPVLGDKPLDKITVSDVQDMLDQFKHLSFKTLKDAKGILSQIFKYAISDELIKKNPCLSVDIEIPSDKKSERTALSVDEYKDIIANLHLLNDSDRRFLGRCMYTAMRRGEALGVRWDDIDGSILHIRRNVTHPQQNTPVITTPKTSAGIRDIPIVEPLAEILSPIQKSGYIVGGGDKPLSLSAYRARWERINKTIDMHGATPHVLRHSYLTYAVGETNDYKTVQGISGHADLNTLLNTYAHSQANKVVELANNVTKILA